MLRRCAPLLLLAAAVVGGPPLARGYQALCAGPVDTYPLLAAAREAARDEAASASPSSPVSPAAVRAAALDLLLQVKQSDVVAFPAHALAGAALEAGGCPAEAAGDQWRKAAGHAWSAEAAGLAAAGLARTLDMALGDQAAIETLRRYAAAEPWHADNLARVEQTFRSLSSPTPAAAR